MFKNVFSALLADKKISKAKFAEEIGVARQTVYSWLDGNFSPDKKTEEKIAAYFNVSIDYLRGVAASVVGWTVIPLLGTVPAGNPVEAVECHEGRFSLPAHIARRVDFGLRVKGESMTNAGILSGDVVFVKMQPTAEQIAKLPY